MKKVNTRVSGNINMLYLRDESTRLYYETSPLATHACALQMYSYIYILPYRTQGVLPYVTDIS